VKRRRRDDDDGEPGERTLTDAEWLARAMADVVPLRDRRERVRAEPPIEVPKGPRASTPPPAREQPDEDDDSASSFAVPGVDRREIRKLKRGDHVPGRRLDLHGVTAAEAVAKVTRFIADSRPLHRCVCIIHGRGLHSAGNVAILKMRVRACLRRHQAVLAYADAPPSDGGAGAVYVLLRKSARG
jgi:DNA-nicking Smr family endonuclease